MDFLQDCHIWLQFLEEATINETGVCHPFIDFDCNEDKPELFFYLDASKNPNFGIGAIFNQNWICEKWPKGLIKNCDPSIEFLELYGLTGSLFAWRKSPELNNARISIFCDNQAVHGQQHVFLMHAVHEDDTFDSTFVYPE